MTSFKNAFVAGACAFGMALTALPAEAASASSSSQTVGGFRMDQIQKVDRRGGGHWRGGGYGGGRRWSGGGGRYYGGGYGGRRYGYYGGGRRYGYYNGRRNYGGYAAAGVLGLATGAIIASNYDRPYYRDGYYRSYGGAECQVISRGRDRYGRPIRVVRYRPC